MAAQRRLETRLQARGARFSHPGTLATSPAHLDGPTALQTYADLVASETAQHGYTSVDAIGITPDTPNLPTLRAKFLSEHTHEDDEARFMAEGAGCFYLHAGGEVLILEVSAGDLVSVPAGMCHWFDMGARPHFTAIRFFVRPDGWIAQFTGDTIANRFPLYAGAA